MSKSEWETYITHENTRLRKYRNPAKDGSCAKRQPYPYRSAQTLGNAANRVHRVHASLPGSPRKRKAVVNALATEVGLKVSGPSTPMGKRGLI